MDEQPHGPPPQTRWSLEHTVAVLHQNGFKLKLDTLFKFDGGIEFEVHSAQDSYGQSIVFKYHTNGGSTMTTTTASIAVNCYGKNVTC